MANSSAALLKDSDRRRGGPGPPGPSWNSYPPAPSGPRTKGPDGLDRRPDAGVGTRGHTPASLGPRNNGAHCGATGCEDGTEVGDLTQGSPKSGGRSTAGGRRVPECGWQGAHDMAHPSSPSSLGEPLTLASSKLCSELHRDRGNDGHGVGSGLSMEHSRREEDSYTGPCPWRGKKLTLPWWVGPAPLDSRVALSACVP